MTWMIIITAILAAMAVYFVQWGAKTKKKKKEIADKEFADKQWNDQLANLVGALKKK